MARDARAAALRRALHGFSFALFAGPGHGYPPHDGPLGGGVGCDGPQPDDRRTDAHDLGPVSRSGRIRADGHADVHVHHAGASLLLASVYRSGQCKAAPVALPAFHLAGALHQGAGRTARSSAFGCRVPDPERAGPADGTLLRVVHLGCHRGELRRLVHAGVAGGRNGLSEQSAFSPDFRPGGGCLSPQGAGVVLFRDGLVLAGSVVAACHRRHRRCLVPPRAAR